MLNWLDFLAQQERYKDLLREAEGYRLIRKALADRPRRTYLHCQALVWLGRWLVVLGYDLLERYGAAAEAPRLLVERRSQ
jgi:hypothetical protein